MLQSTFNWFDLYSSYLELTTSCVHSAPMAWAACSSSNLVLVPGCPSCAGSFIRHFSASKYALFSCFFRVCLKQRVTKGATKPESITTLTMLCVAACACKPRDSSGLHLLQLLQLAMLRTTVPVLLGSSFLVIVRAGRAESSS